MEALILDSNYDTLAVLDTFDSFIWTDRYQQFGDFEIYMPVRQDVLEFLKQENYLMTKTSDRMMIIEDIFIDTDIETGNYLTITGRSLESILERRIVWGQTVLAGSFQDGIQKLLNENAISPSNEARKIPKLIFKASTDKYITELTIDVQLYGNNLYEAIVVLCEEKKIGFRVLPSEDGGLMFELYRGHDRSYSQDVLPRVEFSSEFENLLSSNYMESSRALKTATLVAGEGEGSAKKTIEATVEDGGGTGLSRREMFTDASGVSSTTADGTLTAEEYETQLIQNGKEALSETSITKSFEGQIDATTQFIYGKDFFLGDVVQIVNEYGMEAKSIVSEIVQSQDVNGEAFIPTFTAME